jgi:hypothetical protein
MATTSSQATTPTSSPASRKGLRTGVVSELSVFLKVKPGREQALRKFFSDESADPVHAAQGQQVLTDVGTLHESRYVLFDGDTRLLVATSFDGDWDIYIDDFSRSAVLRNWGRFLIHCEGFPEAEDVPALSLDQWKDFLTANQVTACEYFRPYGELTVKEIFKAQRVVTAFGQLLDEASS